MIRRHRMTLGEIRDDYVRSLQREFWKIGKDTPRINDKTIAMDMSEAFQEIQRRHSVLQGYNTITTSSGNNVYNLPSDFGKMKKVMYSDLELEEMTFNELITKENATTYPTHYAMYTSGNTQQIVLYPTPNDAYTVYLYYYLDLGFYSPSGDTNQNWGNFDGAVFSGTPKLPERYNKAVKSYMLGLYFPEWEQRYEREMLSLRESRVSSLPKLKYKMGGYTPSKELKSMTLLSSSSTTAASGTSSDAIPDKFYYFTWDYATETITKVDSSGWTTELTTGYAGGDITITSADSEFSTTKCLVTPSHTMTTWSILAGAVTITPPTSTNIFVKIEQWA